MLTTSFKDPAVPSPRRLTLGMTLSLPTALPLASVLLLSGAPAHAQQASARTATTDTPIATAPNIVDEVVVKGKTIRAEQSAFSTTTITTDLIRAKRLTKIEQALRDVSGTFVSDYNLGGVASPIVIRGFGAGGHGGDVGVVIDGIPLNEAVSHADGYVDLSVVVPLEIGAFTVFKGPVSALYGNFNRGGLIALETRKGGDYTNADFRYGSFNTTDAQVAFGAKIDDRQQINLAAQAYYTDGFRPQSDGYRLTFAGRYSIDLTEKLNLALSTRLHKSYFNDPAYLNIKFAEVDPDQLNPGVQNDRADKEFGTFRADLNYKLTPDIKLLTFAYTTQQNLARAYSRPINAALLYRQRDEVYQREVYGTGASLNGRVMLLNRPVNFVTGIEYFSEATAYQFYDGLIQRRHNAAINDRESTLHTLSAFGEAQVPLHRMLDLSLGLRVDNFTGDCTRKGPETTTDPCGPLNEITPVSPKIGLRFKALPSLIFRASYAEGFALPSAFVKYSAGAAGVDVQGLAQYEVGAKFMPLPNLDFDVAAYRLTSDGEIATVGPGVYEATGKTTRRGVEASVNWRATDQITVGGVYGYADSEVTANRNPILIGKKVAGVPDVTATLNLAYTPIKPLTLNFTARYVGVYFADSANILQAHSFDIYDLGASYALSTRRPVRLTLDLKNLADKNYATAVFRSQGTELVSPAAPRAVYAGIQLDF